jgi:hypothetical protein
MAICIFPFEFSLVNFISYQIFIDIETLKVSYEHKLPFKDGF